MRDGENTDARRRLADALLKADSDGYERSLSLLCREIGVAYANKLQVIERVFMFAEIGQKLCVNHKAFKYKKRGRPRKAPLEKRDVMLSMIADRIIENRVARGLKTTTAEIAAEWASFAWDQSGKEYDPFSIGQQIARGRAERKKIDRK